MVKFSNIYKDLRDCKIVPKFPWIIRVINMAPCEVTHYEKVQNPAKNLQMDCAARAESGSSIHSKMLNNTLQITDVLQDKTAIIACKKSNREISRFIAQKITEFIQEAVLGTSQETNESAMKIISFNNRIILGAISDSEETQNIARSLLKQEDVEWRVIGNLCKIIEQCLAIYPDTIETSFAFVPEMIVWADQPGVFSLLSSLLTWKAHAAIIEFMKENEIVKTIIQKITDDWEVLDEYTIVALYKLLITCVDNIEFENDCYSPHTIEFAIDYLTDDTASIQSVQWKLLTALINRDSIRSFTRVGELAFSMATSDGGTEGQVEATNFLCHLYELDPYSSTMYDNEHLIKELTRLFIKYSTHTIYMSAISQFLVTSLELPDVRPYVLECYFPAALEIIEANTNRTQIAYIVQIGRQLNELMKGDSELNHAVEMNTSLSHFLDTRVAETERLLNREYGKMLPSATLPGAPVRDLSHEMFPVEV